MPYRRTEFDRGDMPRGGFLGNVFGSVTHAIGGAVKGFITGGPAGAIGGAAGAAIRYNLNQGSSGATVPIGSIAPPAINVTSPEELQRQHQVSIHKGQASGAIQGRPGAGAVVTAGKSGAIAQIHAARGGGGGKRRSMRVTNVKALRRAIRRATGFSKLAMKTIKIVHPQKKGKFGGWKKKRSGR